MRPSLRVIQTFILLAGVAALAACARTRTFSGTTIPIAGLAPTVEIARSKELVYDTPLRLEIDNAVGSVEVTVDPTIKAPLIRAVVQSDARAVDKPWVAAQLIEDVEIEGGGSTESVLQIVGTPPAGEKAPLRIMVWVPKALGVRITNNNGRVRVVGVTGDVEVFNGLGTLLGGEVTVEMAGPVTGQVRVRTAQGDAKVTMPATSSGEILVRGGVSARIDDASGAVVGMTGSGGISRGRFRDSNKGSITHEVRADEGNATMRVRSE